MSRSVAWRLVNSESQFNSFCFLAEHGVWEHGPMPSCDGKLIRAHLLPRRLLLRELKPVAAVAAIDDPRSWVMACGGPIGCSGHHGAFDWSRRLRLPRMVVPAATEALAVELGLDWWLTREYGPLGGPLEEGAS